MFCSFYLPILSLLTNKFEEAAHNSKSRRQFAELPVSSAEQFMQKASISQLVINGFRTINSKPFRRINS